MTIEIYADSRGQGTCRSCGAALEWAEVVASGRRMPFDGPLVAVRTQGDLLGGGRVIEVVDTTVTPTHWERCPQAKDWRRR